MQGFIDWIDGLSKGLKVLVFFFFWGWIFNFLYRLFKFIQNTEKTTNLIGAIVSVCPFIGQIFGIVEWVMVILNNKPTLLVE